MPLVAHLVDGLSAEQLAFRFGFGSLCLDFLGTVGEPMGPSFERLRRPRDLGRWLVEAQLLSAPPRATRHHLAEARELRWAIDEAVRARVEGRPPDTGCVRTLNWMAAGEDLAPQLGGGWALVRIARDRAAASLAAVARDAILLVTGPDVGRIRECAGFDCSRIFVDRSRPGQRRWCLSERCGNRAKTRAYRRRQSTPARRAE